MVAYPRAAEVNRVLPKNRVYAHASASRNLQRRFVEEVDKIVWRYKLAPETVNLPARRDILEIQVFALQLKARDVHTDVLRAIDRTIRHPIAFQLVFGREMTFAMAWKRQNEADPSKWVVGEHFRAPPQLQDEASLQPLPSVLDLAALHDVILQTHLPVRPRPGESLSAHVSRTEQLAKKQREIARTESLIQRERQFNRKVELNHALKCLRAEVAALVE